MKADKTRGIDNEYLNKLLLESASRILMSQMIKAVRVNTDDKTSIIFCPGEFISLDPDGNGTTISLGDAGLKVREGLVGIASVYYDPNYLDADSVQQVIDSWNWMFSNNNFSKDEFETFLEGMTIIRVIMTGEIPMYIQQIMSLAINMKKLNGIGINTDEKISELMSKSKGNWRKIKKYVGQNRTDLVLIQIDEMLLTIADMLVESILAIESYSCGFKMQMKKSPDLLIENIKVEVKNVRHYTITSNNFETKLNTGIKQGGEIIAIFTRGGIKSIKHNKITWWPIESLSTSLSMSLDLCKKGRKCVLLLTKSGYEYFGRMGLIR